MPIPITVDQLVDNLTALIERGEPGYRPGDKLPTYAQLADQYQTSAPTVARAMRRLRLAGLIVGVSGQGTYVSEDRMA